METKVITWSTPQGATISICLLCEEALTAAGNWPRDQRGNEYCNVYQGLHDGACEWCGAGEDE